MIMKKTFQTIVVLLTFACVAMVGCTDDWDVVGVRPSDVICFTATLGDPAALGTSRSTSGHLAIEEEEWRLEGVATEGKSESRGGLTTALSGKANVIGIADEALEFSFRGDELTSVGSPKYWKDMTKRDFTVYAYAPHDVTTVNATDKTITFTVADEVAEQKDVIVATRAVVYDADDATKSDFNKTIPLTFNHILTAVRFKLGFSAEVKSITVSGVKNQGVYNMVDGTWSSQAGSQAYEITSASEGNELLMIPQTLTSGAKVTLECTDGTKLEAPLDEQEWKPGKLVTYTLYEGTPPTPIYLDLAAADVIIKGDTYSGAYYETNNSETKKVEVKEQAFTSASKIHVYQSTQANQSTTGMVNGMWVLPTYQEVTHNGKPWRDYITNNTSVEDVIEAWDNAAGAGKSRRIQDGTDSDGKPKYKVEYDNPNGAGAQGAVRSVGREATKYRIHISETTENVNLIIDNIYSTYQQSAVGRTTGSIAFVPGNSSILTINMKGDNRLGCIHYSSTIQNGSQLIFEGTGSLTVADADYYTDNHNGGNEGVGVMNDTTYFSNHWCAAIGNNDSNDNCYGIVINSGIIFAGTTKAENCTALGAGGNGYGEVTINGGTVTAVAATTGTAIGGGIGFNYKGGEGYVAIHNGNVYAYNHANKWDIPSSAIGGAGSKKAAGNTGTVIITGGNVYAQSAIGTAIGGGSSYSTSGGDAVVTISGGKVAAKSLAAESGETAGKIIPAGAGIGGGTGSSSSGNANGGNATVTISGNPIIRTGSIGGGRKGEQSSGTIGYAKIEIMEGSTADIQAQFILAAGASEAPAFKMNGGTIRNSNTADTEYLHVKEQGGAVYLEDGECTINGGTIENCTAETGGAIYIAGTYNEEKGEYNASFTMSEGTIKNCTSKTDGGAVYLKGGNVTLTGGTISDNLAQGGNGGALYLMEGNFEMSNAEITKNSAMLRNDKGGNGGGVYITSSDKAKNNVEVTITSGDITANTSDRKGGGICVVMPEVSNNGNRLLADVTVGDEGGSPNISGNNAIMQGGGLYVEGQGTFDAASTNSFYGFNTQVTINNGTVKGNSTTAYVPNNDIVNEKGIVTLNDGDVPYVTVTFHGNGGKVNGGSDAGKESYVQKLVTSTNNILLLPDFKRTDNEFLVVKKWNTRADGQGEDYTYTNGASINLSESLELYAVWGAK